MAFIYNVSSDRRIQLCAEELVRTLAIGSSWSRLRLGIRLRFNGLCIDTGGTGNGALAVGLCRGSAGFYDPYTVDYIGFSQGTSTQAGGSWTYAVERSSTTDHALFKKVGASVTASSAGSSATLYIAANNFNHSVLYLDVTRGSPNYTLVGYSLTVGAVASDWSRTSFFTGLETESPITGMAAVNTTTAMAYSGDGYFDSISVLWSRCVPTIDISDIAVCRFL
jgi:hypothetical protein